MKKISIFMILFAVSSAAYGHEVSESQKEWIRKFQQKVDRYIPDFDKILLNTDPEPKLESGFKEMYNKKDLSGWRIISNDPKRVSTFKADGDVIVGSHVPGASNTYLWTTDEYDNFIFTCEIKWLIPFNTGVQFRSNPRKSKDGNLIMTGPQVEMENPIQAKQGRCWSGGIYGQGLGGYFYVLILEAHEAAREATNYEGWNRVTIKAEGQNVKTWINGVPVANWNTDKYLRGTFGFQLHEGKQGKALFRNIKVKELAGKG
jgi:hypothetical protein